MIKNQHKENPEIKPPAPYIEPVKPELPEFIPEPDKPEPIPVLPETEPLPTPEIEPTKT